MEFSQVLLTSILTSKIQKVPRASVSLIVLSAELSIDDQKHTIKAFQPIQLI